MTSIPPRYAKASWHPVSYRADAGKLQLPAMGWVLHVQAGTGDPGGWFQSLAGGHDRRFSHLWAPKSGVASQYTSLQQQSWAQGAGNSRWWSVETEGYPAEPLTDAQLDWLAAWHVHSGTPDRATNSPTVPGIGIHSMGGTAWGGHPGCPGGIRAAQRGEIIRRAQALRQKAGTTVAVPDPAAERAAIAQAVADRLEADRPTDQGGAYYRVHDPDTGQLIVPTKALDQALARLARVERKLDAVLDHITP